MTVKQITDRTLVEGLRLVALPVHQLVPNDYNPNKLTDNEFAAEKARLLGTSSAVPA